MAYRTGQQMAYEHTEVPVSRTQEQIRRMVLENGGSAVAFISQPPSEGFEAMVVIDGATYKIRISAQVKPEPPKRVRRRWSGTSWVAKKSDTDRHEEAARRVWRVLFFYLKSVYEASNSGVMDFRQLVMPYVVTRDDRTVAEHILPKLAIAIQGHPERMLPAPKES